MIMTTVTINIDYNGIPRIALIRFNFIKGIGGNSVGDPDSCFESIDDVYELESLHIQFGHNWLNKTTTIKYFERHILEELQDFETKYRR